LNTSTNCACFACLSFPNRLLILRSSRQIRLRDQCLSAQVACSVRLSLLASENLEYSNINPVAQGIPQAAFEPQRTEGRASLPHAFPDRLCSPSTQYPLFSRSCRPRLRSFFFRHASTQRHRGLSRGSPVITPDTCSLWGRSICLLRITHLPRRWRILAQSRCSETCYNASFPDGPWACLAILWLPQTYVIGQKPKCRSSSTGGARETQFRLPLPYPECRQPIAKSRASSKSAENFAWLAV
jgi:hypothetical protein